jgi:hypothetical protein
MLHFSHPSLYSKQVRDFLLRALPERVRIRNLMHVAPVLASAIAAAQVLVEGTRWQMDPAYALTVLCFLVWLLEASVGTYLASSKVDGTTLCGLSHR